MSQPSSPVAKEKESERAISLRQLLDRMAPRFAFRVGFIFGACALAVLIFVVFFVSRLANGGRANVASNAATTTDGEASPIEDVKGPVTLFDDDHFRGGDRNAKIALVEYSDFECPFCKRFHGTPEEIIAKNSKTSTVWVYRHYPLPFHEDAQPAAEASECVAQQAGEEGFWKFTDTYFERTTSGGTGYARDQWAGLAEESGAKDKAAFEACLANGTFTANVNAEKATGDAIGVSGTPGTIVLNTKTGKAKLISGAYPVETFMTAIAQVLVEPSLWDRIQGLFGKGA